MFTHFSPFSALGGCIDEFGTSFCQIFINEPEDLLIYCNPYSNIFVSHANFIEFTQFACKASCGNCYKANSRGWTNNKHWRLVLPIKRSHTPLSQERILEFFRCSLKCFMAVREYFPALVYDQAIGLSFNSTKYVYSLTKCVHVYTECLVPSEN